VQGTVLFGRFIINLQWMVLAVSGVLGYFVIRLRLKGVELFKEVITETIFDSLVIIILVWKLSLILFHPVKFITNPMTLIYFSGGTRGFLLGLAIAAAYLFYSSRKQGVSVWIYADLIASGALAATILYSLIALVLSKELLLLYGSRSLLAALLLLWQVKKLRVLGKIENLNQLLMWYTLGEIFIFNLNAEEVNSYNLILSFSLKQIIFYALAIISIGLNLIFGKKRNNL
jgi:hypothetical protein